MGDRRGPRAHSTASFAELFGREPEVTADAPGRVNLVGEHTDYNDGYVLPVAISHKTTVELARRADGTVRAWSDAFAALGIATFRLGEEARGRGWLDYVQGVTQALAGMGAAVGGFDARVRSTVPVGAGVSSSAALEVALLRGLRRLFGLTLDDVALARAGQRAEHDLVGAPVGIMDQMAALFAGRSTALFLDTRSLAFERVPLPPSLDIAVVHSGLGHEHATGEYRRRREQCEEAARLLGAERLRDVPIDVLPALAGLPSPLGARARHVLTENRRVLQAVEALRAGDAEEVGRLVSESHRSLRDDFEVSLPAIDRLVARAERHPSVLGARITGGGFGGSIVVITRAGEAARVARAIVEDAPGDGEARPVVVQA